MPWAQVAGVRLHYQDRGSGPVLVLVHGLGGSSEDWQPQITEFARDFRVIAPDLRGFGESEHRGPYSIPQFAMDVQALLQGLGVDRFDLVGHSMGGAVAMEMSARQPADVHHLALTNTLPDFHPASWPHYLMIGSRFVLMSCLGPRRMAERSAAYLYPAAALADLRARVVARSARNRRWPYLASLWSLSHWSAASRLRSLKLPMLVLSADQDYLDARAQRRFADELPASTQYRSFAAARHGLPLEDPARFNPVLRQFLESSLESAPEKHEVAA